MIFAYLQFSMLFDPNTSWFRIKIDALFSRKKQKITQRLLLISNFHILAKAEMKFLSLFQKILLRENETIKVVEDYDCLLSYGNVMLYTVSLVCFVIFHWKCALLLNVSQKDICFVNHNLCQAKGFKKLHIKINTSYPRANLSF